MKSYKVAWRNLWRNRRRTIITVASVFFAVFFALVMRSLQLGSYDHMFRNVIESYTGYIQIQDEDFKDDGSVDDAFRLTPELEKMILSDNNVTALIPRFESFALASAGALTQGVLVMGVDPEKESLLSNVRGRLVKYKLTDKVIDSLKKSGIPEKVKTRLGLLKGNAYASRSMLQLELGIRDDEAASEMPLIEKISSFRNGYFSAGQHEAVAGDRLATYLRLGIGDTIVLIGQGYHGTTAAGKFRVAGVVKLPTPDLNSRIVYLPADISQEFYNAPGMVTSVALHIRDTRDKTITRTARAIGKELAPPLKVLDWKEMNELLLNQMDADSKSGMILIAILYMIIAFGIFGTVLMMTAERRREFGVLVAIGMQKTKLAAVVTCEMIYIGILGILCGIVAALPVILIGRQNPIRFSGEMAKMYEDYGLEPVMTFMPVGPYFLWQSVVVAIIVLLAVIYPIRKIFRMNVVNSLKA
jgi:ABC-type lipoprotein release transport system permease subunit